MERSTWKKIGVLLVILVLAFTCFGCTKPDAQSEQQPVSDQTNSSTVEIPLFDEPQQKPTKIKIDKIGVDEAIDPVKFDKDEYMPTPSGAKGVTWLEYAGFSSPGWTGNAVLTGHNYVNNDPGTFVKLHELVVGDIVEFTYADGSKGRFTVKSVDTYDENNKDLNSIVYDGDTTRTTIVTCAGTRKQGGGYPQRCVVICEATEHIGANGEKLTAKAPDEGSLR